jgi:uncharacterized repeat protein (TIGR02543 family)
MKPNTEQPGSHQSYSTFTRYAFWRVLVAIFLLTLPLGRVWAFAGYALTTSTVGRGTVTATIVSTPNGRGNLYFPGTVLSLSAVADKGWTFMGWSGDVTGKSSPVSLTMDGDKSVTATFVHDPTLQIGGAGKRDGVFHTSSSTCEVRGLCTDVDKIYWKFLGDSQYHVVSASGATWKITVRPQVGVNYLRVYGLNKATGVTTPVHNGAVIRQ